MKIEKLSVIGKKLVKLGGNYWRQSIIFSVFIFVLLLSVIIFPSLTNACEGPAPSFPASDPTTGNLGLIDFSHPTDPGAPQFYTLVEGNARPNVTSLFLIKNEGIPPDAPSDFANLVGFDAGSNSILVPSSGYDIGQGYGVTVLFANPSAIVLKYGNEDDITCGYTLYLSGITVNSELVALYNTLSNIGREQLPALKAGERLGQGAGQMLVAIRDTGMFLDPRWHFDWWQGDTPATGSPYQSGQIAISCICGFPPGPGLPPLPPKDTYPVCQNKPNQDRQSWPNRCKDCNETRYLTSDCAQSFNMNATLSNIRKNHCEGYYSCDGHSYINRDWNGAGIINPADFTEVPFAGKTKTWMNSEKEDEIKYLADYFEGTHEYYRDYPIEMLGFVVSHGTSYINMSNRQGVLRKLSPYEYQNAIKKMMVERAIASNNGQLTYGEIRDYQLSWPGRLCWNAPLILQLLETVAVRVGMPVGDAWKVLDFCLYDLNASDTVLINALYLFLRGWNDNPLLPLPDVTFMREFASQARLSELYGHFPPASTESDYVKKWEDWKNSGSYKEWWKLWQTVPMVTREATLGYILATPQLRPPNPSAGQPGDSWSGDWVGKTKVPHLARLWESSRWIQKILLPAEAERTADNNQFAFDSSSGNQNFFAETSSGVVAGSSCNNQEVANNSCGTSEQSSSKVLAAQTQASGGNDTFLNVAVYITPSGGSNYEVCWSTYAEACGQPMSDTSTPVTVTHNGGPVGGCNLGVYGGLWTSPLSCHDGDCSPVNVSANPGDQICVNVRVENGFWQCPFDPRQTDLNTTTCCTIKNDGSTDCSSMGPPIPVPSCGKSPVPTSDYCVKEAMIDTNDNDKLCNGTITGGLKGHEEIQNDLCPTCHDISDFECDVKYPASCATCAACSILPVPPPGCQDACDYCNGFPTECCEYFSVSTYREMEVKTFLPYLEQTWDQTTLVDQGFFNLFKPAEIDEYKEKYAKDFIQYVFACDRHCSSADPDIVCSCSVDPALGDFYYRYLGGVQLGKLKTIKSLTPVKSN